MQKTKQIKKGNKPDKSAYEVKGLDESWNDRFLELSERAPVRTERLQIHFDRSPDIFTIPKLTSYRNVPLGLFHDDHLIGCAVASYQKRYINGALTDVIYLGNMHVIERGTGHIFLKKLSERVVQKMKDRPEVKYLYAYVMEGNRPADKLARLGELDSRWAGSVSMSTILTIKPIALDSKYTVRKAEMADVDQIVALLSDEYRQQWLAPEMSKKRFLQNLKNRQNIGIKNYFLAIRNNEVVGTCLAWDMTPFKKNRIWFHGFRMGLIRFGYHIAARLTGNPPLPKPGEAVKDVTIAEYAVRDRDPKIMEALLRFVYREYRRKGYQAVIFGCDSHDPIIKATKPFISREVRSRVIITPLQENSKRNLIPPDLIFADAIQI